MPYSVAQYPLSLPDINEGIDAIIEVQASHGSYHIWEKVRIWIELLLSGKISWFSAFEDAINQVLVNKTLWPHLRHEKDNGAARTIVQSHVWWYGALVLTLLDRNYISDTTSFFDQDLLRWFFYSYIASRKSQNIKGLD
jgi:hypothetical protein